VVFGLAALQGASRFGVMHPARQFSLTVMDSSVAQGRIQLGGSFGGALSFRWVVCSPSSEREHALASDNGCP